MLSLTSVSAHVTVQDNELPRLVVHPNVHLVVQQQHVFVRDDVVHNGAGPGDDAAGNHVHEDALVGLDGGAAHVADHRGGDAPGVRLLREYGVQDAGGVGVGPLPTLALAVIEEELHQVRLLPPTQHSRIHLNQSSTSSISIYQLHIYTTKSITHKRT